jgi:hypothetical protein
MGSFGFECGSGCIILCVSEGFDWKFLIGFMLEIWEMKDWEKLAYSDYLRGGLIVLIL